MNFSNKTAMFIGTSAVILAFAAFAGPMFAAAHGNDNEDKVAICHQTGNDNHWVSQDVKANEVQSHIDNGDFVIDSNHPCPPLPPVQTIRINATKIICDNESDLPNWGAGGANITASTASAFVAAHPSCHTADWTFQYANSNITNPGDSFQGLASGWTSFAGIADLPLPLGTSYLWVREAPQDGYIPFSGWLSNGDNTPTEQDQYSAEMYCNTDVLNYDNYDRIDPTPAFADGNTYYCVAFNVLTTPPAPTTGGLVVIKTFGTGTTTPDQFSFTVNGGEPTAFNSNGENDFSNLTPGAYSVAEVATTTYTTSYSEGCTAGVVAGATTTCTITNNLVPVNPPPVVCGENQTLVEGQCVDNSPAPTTDNTNTDNTDNNGGGGGGGGGGWVGGCTTYGNGDAPWWGTTPCSGSNGGLVLGASTGPSCSALLGSYMGLGKKNNAEDVKKLQTFLNSEINAGLTVNGIFDQATANAVKAFQLKYWEEVLAPWKPFGLGDHSPTGYVYKTTLRWINNLSCSSLNIPLPELP